MAVCTGAPAVALVDDLEDDPADDHGNGHGNDPVDDLVIDPADDLVIDPVDDIVIDSVIDPVDDPVIDLEDDPADDHANDYGNDLEDEFRKFIKNKRKTRSHAGISMITFPRHSYEGLVLFQRSAKCKCLHTEYQYVKTIYNHRVDIPCYSIPLSILRSFMNDELESSLGCGIFVYGSPTSDKVNLQYNSLILTKYTHLERLYCRVYFTQCSDADYRVEVGGIYRAMGYLETMYQSSRYLEDQDDYIFHEYYPSLRSLRYRYDDTYWDLVTTIRSTDSEYVMPNLHSNTVVDISDPANCGYIDLHLQVMFATFVEDLDLVRKNALFENSGSRTLDTHTFFCSDNYRTFVLSPEFYMLLLSPEFHTSLEFCMQLQYEGQNFSLALPASTLAETAFAIEREYIDREWSNIITLVVPLPQLTLSKKIRCLSKQVLDYNRDKSSCSQFSNNTTCDIRFIISLASVIVAMK